MLYAYKCDCDCKRYFVAEVPILAKLMVNPMRSFDLCYVADRKINRFKNANKCYCELIPPLQLQKI